MSRRLKLKLLYYSGLVGVGVSAWWISELMNRATP